MKKIKFFVAVFSFISVVFLSCKSKEANLVLGDWNLVRYNLDGRSINFSKATISFDQTESKSLKVSGFSGVNLFSGSYDVSGKKISSKSDFITTRMAGPKQDMEFERAFLASLNGAEGIEVKVENGKQVLYIYNSSEKSELAFEKSSIKDNAWILSSILKKDAVVSINVDENELPTLNFNAENKASGFSGVNYYNMDYTLDEENKKLSFTLGISTLMASGSKEAMELEQQFFINMDQVASYSISGNSLTLRSKDGKTLFVFIKESAE